MSLIGDSSQTRSVILKLAIQRSIADAVKLMYRVKSGAEPKDLLEEVNMLRTFASKLNVLADLFPEVSGEMRRIDEGIQAVADYITGCAAEYERGEKACANFREYVEGALSEVIGILGGVYLWFDVRGTQRGSLLIIEDLSGDSQEVLAEESLIVLPPLILGRCVDSENLCVKRPVLDQEGSIHHDLLDRLSGIGDWYRFLPDEKKLRGIRYTKPTILILDWDAKRFRVTVYRGYLDREGGRMHAEYPLIDNEFRIKVDKDLQIKIKPF